MKQTIYFSLFVFLFTLPSFAETRTGFANYGSLKAHYGVYNPEGVETIGDILFLHGYGDTFKNHVPLFQEWNRIGLRVIAFDFPSHGKTSGGGWDDLDWYSFQDLAELASSIRRETLEDSSRPLFLSGWSTGGLLAIRILQSEGMRSLFPTISGLVVYAPGVSVKKCVGNLICHITNETLTHNELLQNRTIQPTSPSI